MFQPFVRPDDFADFQPSIPGSLNPAPPETASVDPLCVRLQTRPQLREFPFPEIFGQPPPDHAPHLLFVIHYQNLHNHATVSLHPNGNIVFFKEDNQIFRPHLPVTAACGKVRQQPLINPVPHRSRCHMADVRISCVPKPFSILFLLLIVVIVLYVLYVIYV